MHTMSLVSRCGCTALVLTAAVAVLATAADLEDKFDAETQRCKELAQTRHPGDPNASLDHFLLCIANKLQQVKNLMNNVVNKVVFYFHTLHYICV